jgi:hypothetical protein
VYRRILQRELNGSAGGAWALICGFAVSEANPGSCAPAGFRSERVTDGRIAPKNAAPKAQHGYNSMSGDGHFGRVIVRTQSTVGRHVISVRQKGPNQWVDETSSAANDDKRHPEKFAQAPRLHLVHKIGAVQFNGEIEGNPLADAAG